MTSEQLARVFEAGWQALRGKSPELAGAFLAMARTAHALGRADDDARESDD